jgi:hypothetical protein
MPHVDNNLIFYLIYVTVKDKIERVSYYFLNLYYAHIDIESINESLINETMLVSHLSN